MIDGLNRLLLLVLGLVLCAAGGLGLAANQGAFDDLESPAVVYEDAVREVEADPDLWFAVVLGAASLVLLLAVVWLLRQFAHRPGGPHLSTEVVAAGRRGRTTLEPVKVAGAVAGDLETLPGVRRASVRILSLEERPTLRARLDVDRDADPDDILRHCEDALRRCARCLDAPAVDARIRLDFAGRDEARVA